MRKAETEKMERQEAYYNYLLFELIKKQLKLDKVTLLRKKNQKGRLISNVVCYLVDCGGNIKNECFRLYDDEYLWFMCAIEQDFPEVQFADLTDEKDKVQADGV